MQVAYVGGGSGHSSTYTLRCSRHTEDSILDSISLPSGCVISNTELRAIKQPKTADEGGRKAIPRT